MFIVAPWVASAHNLGTASVRCTYNLLCRLNEVQDVCFPEVVKTLPAVWDKSFVKLDKEEAENGPRKKLGLSENISLG